MITLRALCPVFLIYQVGGHDAATRLLRLTMILYLTNRSRKSAIRQTIAYRTRWSQKITFGSPNGPYLLKLHGSANWGICAGCKKTIEVLDEKVTDDPVRFREKACGKCEQSAFQPLLVPPSWDKTEFRDVLRPVWAQALKVLERATRICIIGYSMPPIDAFFRYLLTLALARNHNLYKLVVVDLASQARFDVQGHPVKPRQLEPPNVRERFEELLDDVFRSRRFEYFDAGLAEFIGRNMFKELLERADGIDGAVQRG